MESKQYRVAQWATGHTGMSSLRSIIEHPQMELVGVYVYSDHKLGKDAGELCGKPVTGVTATRDIEDIVAAQPDCVMYMPLLDHESVDDICRLLESGSNVVTTVTTFHHPPSIDSEVRRRLEAACERGGTSIYDTGSCPGFITEVVPLALLVMERQFELFRIDQYADVSTRQSPEFLGKFFGIPADEADLEDNAQRSALTDGASLRQIADAMSVPLDDMTATAEVALATKTEEIAVMTIKEGTVGGYRQKLVGLRGGKPLLEYTRTIYVTKHLDPDWGVLDTSWQLFMEGDAPMEINMRWSTHDYGTYSPGINSNLPINSVPAVCDAHPGILTTADLRIIPNFS